MDGERIGTTVLTANTGVEEGTFEGEFGFTVVLLGETKGNPVDIDCAGMVEGTREGYREGTKVSLATTEVGTFETIGDFIVGVNEGKAEGNGIVLVQKVRPV